MNGTKKNEDPYFWAWLAGYIDADGSIGIYRSRKQTLRGHVLIKAVVIYSSKKKVLDFICRILQKHGIDVKHYERMRRDTRENRRSLYCDGSVQIRSARAILKILDQCLPFFQVKLEQAKLMQQYVISRGGLVQNHRGYMDKEYEIYEQLKYLNRREIDE